MAQKQERRGEMKKSSRTTSGRGSLFARFLLFARFTNCRMMCPGLGMKAFFKLVDREGKVKIDDLVRVFRDYYAQRLAAGEPLEQDASLMARPAEASNEEIKRLLIDMPVQRFLIKNFIEYFPEEGVLRIAPQLWQLTFKLTRT